VRIVVAEDLYLLRDGLVRLLEAHGHEVVAAVGDKEATLRALAEHRPDVAVVDVRMPPTHTDDGLRAALEARRAQPDLSVLVLSQHIEQLYARELLADGRGGVGYLLKDRVFDAEQFVEAVERVGAGGTSLDPTVVAKILNAGSTSPLDALTDREREVLAVLTFLGAAGIG
jgi:DNA-binding NarL/FixJ family response regulator